MLPITLILVNKDYHLCQLVACHKCEKPASMLRNCGQNFDICCFRAAAFTTKEKLIPVLFYNICGFIR